MILKRILAVSLLGAAFAAVATPAYADRDAVQFFSNIRVAPNAAVHDAICFFCSVNVEGEVKGDVVAFFGNIHIAGSANHDVVNFFGIISAGQNAHIGQDLVSFFGMVRLGENVSVGKDLVVIFGSLRVPGFVSVGGDRVAIPAWIFFAPLFVVGLVAFVIVYEVRAYHYRSF
jgi:hypothetical protein